MYEIAWKDLDVDEKANRLAILLDIVYLRLESLEDYAGVNEMAGHETLKTKPDMKHLLGA